MRHDCAELSPARVASDLPVFCRCGILRARCWRCRGDLPGQARPAPEEEGAHRPRPAMVRAGQGAERPALGQLEGRKGGPSPCGQGQPMGAPCSGSGRARVGEPRKGPLQGQVGPF